MSHTEYKGFYIKRGFDRQNGELVYIGTMQGLRLTAETLGELKRKIDSRVALRAEVARMEFKTKPRTGVAFNDYSEMYLEPHEVNQIVNRVTSQGANHYA